MANRRNFLKLSGLGLGGALLGQSVFPNSEYQTKTENQEANHIRAAKPIVISTWKHGLAANAKAWEILSSNGKALDAVQQGVMVPESDPKCTSVGFGGLPDRDGNVTLDACIMDHSSNCGSVSFLQHIKNPIAVARLVMDMTPHIMLSGEGALRFALANGFIKEDLLTPESKAAYEKWLVTSKYEPVINIENHDTIGMLAIDDEGNLAGACTTSGLAWKMHGRVGDSPIIGAGLFVDGEIGAACATGLGEEVIRIAGSAMIVERMRMGVEPEQACKEMVKRIVKRAKNIDNIQVGFLALRKDGNYGTWSIRSGFDYALTVNAFNGMKDSGCHFDGK